MSIFELFQIKKYFLKSRKYFFTQQLHFLPNFVVYLYLFKALLLFLQQKSKEVSKAKMESKFYGILVSLSHHHKYLFLYLKLLSLIKLHHFWLLSLLHLK